MTTPDIDLDALEAAALAATPGPWIACGPSFGELKPRYLNEVMADRDEDGEEFGYTICEFPQLLEEECSADMNYIAAANPAVVLELIRRLRAAEGATK